MDKAFAYGAKDWGFDSPSGLYGVNQFKKSPPLLSSWLGYFAFTEEARVQIPARESPN